MPLAHYTFVTGVYLVHKGSTSEPKQEEALFYRSLFLGDSGTIEVAAKVNIKRIPC